MKERIKAALPLATKAGREGFHLFGCERSVSIKADDSMAALEVLGLPEILTGIVKHLSRHEALKVCFPCTKLLRDGK